MKKATKPSAAPKLAPKGQAPKLLAAKPKVIAKSSAKPKPRKAQGQDELAQVVAQLAISAERLAQAAERLAEATVRTSATARTEQPQRQDEMIEQAGEVIGVMALDETKEE